MNGLVFSEAPDYGRVTYLAMGIIQQVFPIVNFFSAVRAETGKIIFLATMRPRRLAFRRRTSGTRKKITVIAEFSGATKS